MEDKPRRQCGYAGCVLQATRATLVLVLSQAQLLSPPSVVKDKNQGFTCAEPATQSLGYTLQSYRSDKKSKNNKTKLQQLLKL